MDEAKADVIACVTFHAAHRAILLKMRGSMPIKIRGSQILHAFKELEWARPAKAQFFLA